MVPWLRRAGSVRPDTGVEPNRLLSLPAPDTTCTATPLHVRAVRFLDSGTRTCTQGSPRTGVTPHGGRRRPCAGPPLAGPCARSKSPCPDGLSERTPSLACPRTVPGQLQKFSRAPPVRSIGASRPAALPVGAG